LLLLAPLFVIVGAVIKLTSPGPVFYRQERHCFNRARFRIFKFRTMYVQENDGPFRQARRGDPRITPFGAFLRRTNLDELPQLLNVVLGDMSIVGPRPHAVAHDADFEQRIADYTRRHNIKPGITGWAQVNGLRGETDTDEKMRARVEHDLAYVDQWSLLFDMKIIMLTLLSSKAYRNAH
jgi:lipopolysaccharide/colanic/teichoic acid biosynthesis glycosyltransferase